MELVVELFLTASLALFLSFLVAKLVAMAMAGDVADVGRDSNLKSRGVADEGAVEAEVRYEESSRVQGCSESERRVGLFEEALEKVDHLEKIGEEEEVLDGRCELQLPEKVLDEEGSGEQSETVGLPEKILPESEEGEDRAVVEKALDFGVGGVNGGCADDSDGEGLENRGVDETGVESAMKDFVSLQPEEVGIVGGAGEPEGKDEANEVELQNIGDEDDWEGIEKNELENDFAAAVKFVESAADVDGDGSANVGSDVQIELYGLRKVATEGPCHDPQPLPLNFSARANRDGGHWLRCARNAWQRLGNMSPEMAMEQYITLLSDKVPGWMEDHFAGEKKRESSEEELPNAVAPVFTTSLHHQSYSTNEREPELKSAVEPERLPELKPAAEPERVDSTGASELGSSATG